MASFFEKLFKRKVKTKNDNNGENKQVGKHDSKPPEPGTESGTSGEVDPKLQPSNATEKNSSATTTGEQQSWQGSGDICDDAIGDVVGGSTHANVRQSGQLEQGTAGGSETVPVPEEAANGEGTATTGDGETLEEQGAAGGSETGMREEERPHSSTEEEAQQSQELTVAGLKENAKCMTRITNCLDRDHKVLDNWEHFACSVEVPPDVKAKCRMNSPKSGTISLFHYILTSSKTENLTVKKLCDILDKLPRKDVKNIIQKKFPAEADRDGFVRDKICNNFELLEEIAIELDKESTVLKSWKHLGAKLEFTTKELEIMGQVTDPTYALLEYIYSTKKPAIKLQTFRDTAKNIKREDVKKFIDDNYSDLTVDMKSAIPLESNDMQEIRWMLNKKAWRNWKNMAYELGIDREIYAAFNPEKLQSPTKLIFDWLVANKGDLTISYLCNKFKDMKRMDVVEIIEEEFGKHFVNLSE